MTGPLHEDPCKLKIIYGRILLRMGNVSDKSVRENKNTNFVFSNLFLKILLFVK